MAELWWLRDLIQKQVGVLVTSDELRVAELWWLRDLIQKQVGVLVTSDELRVTELWWLRALILRHLEIIRYEFDRVVKIIAVSIRSSSSQLSRSGSASRSFIKSDFLSS